MALTWKKWGVFLILAVSWTVLGHWYATRNLVDIYLNHHGGPGWSLNANIDSLRRLRIPWQTGLWSDRCEYRAFDPDHPQTTDSETLMGIALMGPRPSYHCYPYSESDMGYWSWFGRVARLSLDCAKDSETKHRLQGLLLMDLAVSRPHWIKADKMVAAVAPLPALTPSFDNETYARNLVACQQRIDPTNTFYLYRNAERLIDKRIVNTKPEWPKIPLPASLPTRRADYKPPPPSPEVIAFYKRINDPLPSVQSARDFVLAEPDKLIPYAKEIDGVLTQGDGQGKIRSYTRYWGSLIEKGSRFYWGDDFNQKAYLYYIESAVTTGGWLYAFSPLSCDSYRRLCYLANVLASKGQNDLALRMYRHIYDYACRPIEMVGNSDSNLRLNQSLQNLRLVSLHLMEFWTNQKDARKVLAVHNYIPRLENWHYSASPRDTLIQGNEAGSLYARFGIITWWLSSVGLLLAAISLLAAFWHLISRRERYLTETQAVVSRKRLAISIAVAIGVMIITAFFLPFGPYDCTAGMTMFAWLYPLTALIVIGCGMLAKQSLKHDRSVNVGLAEWVFWRASAAGALSVLLFFNVYLQQDLDGPNFPPLILVVYCMLLGFLFWIVRVLRGWIKKRQPEDRMYRGAVVKSFAVICAGVASVLTPLSVIAALWTYSLQKEAYRTANETYKSQSIAGQTMSIANFEVPDAIPDFSRMQTGIVPGGPGLMPGGPGMGPPGMMFPGGPTGTSFPGLPKDIFELRK